MCSPLLMDRVRSQLSRRRVLGAMGAAVVAGVGSRFAPALAQEATPLAAGPGSVNLTLGSYTQLQDLTHTITPETPVFPGNPQPLIEPLRTYEKDGYYANKITMAEHTGTHMDAPAHFVEGTPFSNELPVTQFFAPLAIVDISERAASDPDAQVTPDDLMAWESEHGELPAGAFVAMNSGWDARFNDPASFINLGDDDVLHFPGFHPDATTMLVEERDIVGIGVDTLSLDYGASTDFGTHITLLGAGKYGLEGLASLGNVPPSGALIIVGGPKITIGSGGWSRVMALL
jgi:kynurenine formamidase